MRPLLTRALRPFAAVSVAALVTAGLGVVTSAPAVADTTLFNCTSGGPRPCVVSVTQNGGTPDSDLDYQASTFELDGAEEVLFSLQSDAPGGGFELGAARRADTFSVTIDMGSVVPRVVSGKASGVTVVRSRTSTGNTVTITGNPVLVSGQCSGSGQCPEADVVVNDPGNFNNVQWDGYFDFQVTDFGQWEDVAQRNALYGLDFFTNVADASLPPAIRFGGPADTAYLAIDLANRRYLDDGTTLVRGHAEMRIPNAFLRSAYGVPNPELMTGDSLLVTGPGTGADVSVTQESGDDAMLVQVDDMTFPDLMIPDGTLRQQAPKTSVKTVRVKRGLVTPNKVTITNAKRLGPHQGRLKVTKAKARGAKVTGYQARCTSGRSVVTTKGAGRTLVVAGLKAGRSYQCRVRALSKAGPGGFSAKKKI